MTRTALACLALLGSALSACADGPVTETVPSSGIGWPFAKKTVVPEGPVEPPVAETASGGTKNPNSIFHATTQEFFARPVVFNVPDEPVKTTQWFWVSGEYLMWRIKDGPLPVPLVSIGAQPLPTPPLNSITMIVSGPGNGGGVLGDPSTAIRYGNEDLEFGTYSGARVAGGFWFGHDNEYEVSLGAFVLGQRSVQFGLSSAANGEPVIARPFFDPATGLESSLLVSSPGAFVGSIGIASTSQLLGFEGNLGMVLSREMGITWQVAAGIRYLNLDEDITIKQRSEELDDGRGFFDGRPIAKSAELGIFDSFSATNQFVGGQFGTSAAYRYGPFQFEGRGKIALGANRTRFSTLGISLLKRASTSEINPELGGFLALQSNIGEESRNNFSVASELGFDVGYCVSTYCILKLGYTFLYWTDVVRPGTMIDRTINSNQIPVSETYQDAGGSARPVQRFDRSDFWAQGLSAGIEFRY